MTAPTPVVLVSVDDLRKIVREEVHDEMRLGGAHDGHDLPDVMTREQVATHLQIHPKVVIRYVLKRGLPAFKMGAQWRFHRNALVRWMADHSKGVV